LAKGTKKAVAKSWGLSAQGTVALPDEFIAEDGVLPELTKYSNKLYVFHCEDEAIAYVCSICRTGFTTLQSFKKYTKETHGWEFY